jgi:hypothetical protein
MGITFIIMIDLDYCHDARYAHGGVHLSFFTKNIFMNALPGAIEQFILTPPKRRYTNVKIISVTHVDFNCS